MNAIKSTTFFLIICICAVSFGQKNETSKETYFSNPILAGFYTDPSICKVDGSFYMVNSTFSYFPGIPIFKSDDLINWKQLGHVLETPEHLDLEGLQVSEGVFAPDISYHNGTFYVVGTVVGKKGNFIVSTKDPAGTWSNPVWLPEIEGIDPALFFEEDDAAYIVYNSTPPDNKPLYNGHRTIKICAINVATKKVTGTPQILVNGGSDIATKPIWIEGPHIFKKNDYYYLIAAEGGTSSEHSEVAFRSKSLLGPYISYENNPILTQRHLPLSRKNAITNTGHADIVQDKNGQWWGVFLGCRPYRKNYFNTGRETFMAPVKWQQDWPVFDLGGDHVKEHYLAPKGVSIDSTTFQYNRLANFKETFESDSLALHWTFLRTPSEKWYDLQQQPGTLILETRPAHCSQKKNPSFIAHRQQHSSGNVAVSLKFNPKNDKESAGLVAFQNEQHYYYIGITKLNNVVIVALWKSNNDKTVLVTSKKLSDPNGQVQLKITAKGVFYDFYFSENNETYQLLKNNMDAKFLSTENAGGFVGTMYGMYTTSNGKKSKNRAFFDWYSYNE